MVATQLLKDFETLFDEVLILKSDGMEQIETEQIREKYKMSVEEYVSILTRFSLQGEGEDDK